MLRRLLLGKGAAGIFSSRGVGGGCLFFFSTSLPRSSSDSAPVTALFRSYGIREEDTNIILRKVPTLGRSNVEKILRPKLDFLRSTGLTDADISKILVANPQLLSMSLENSITPCVRFVKTILPSKDALIRILKTATATSSIESNMEVLRHRGVPGTLILKQLISMPRTFARSKEDFLDAVGHVEDLGLSPAKAGSYLRALSAISHISRSTFGRKTEAFKQLGFSYDQLVAMIKRFPIVLSLSEDRIRKKLEFFSDKTGWSEVQVVGFIRKAPSVLGFSDDTIRKKMEFFGDKTGLSEYQVVEAIRKYPTLLYLSHDNVKKKMEFFGEKMRWGTERMFFYPNLLGMSLQKRIIPRCAVLNILMSRGLLKEVPSPSMLLHANELFFDKYVDRYQTEVPDVVNAFHGHIDFQGWDQFEGSP